MNIIEIIDAASKIPGWMTEAELLWLARTAQTATTVVEVGSWQGRSTLALALAHRHLMTPPNPEAVIYAVDTWAGSDEHEDGKDTKSLSPDTLYSSFLEHLHDHLGREVIPQMLPSVQAAEHYHFQLLLGFYSLIDFCFIDADHSYEHVKADVEAWLPLVRSDGGILAGHDFQHEPVKQALRDTLEYSTVRVAPGTSIWYVQL